MKIYLRKVYLNIIPKPESEYKTRHYRISVKSGYFQIK